MTDHRACNFAAVLVFASTFSGVSFAQEAMPITVTEVLQESVSPGVPTAGTVFSRNEIQITAGIAGRLLWVAEPGDYVNTGDAVARFDCEMLELQREEQIAMAEREKINVATLAREADRLEELRETFVTSETQLERTQADRDLAASELNIAKIHIRQTESQLGRCVARAPFSGVVTERLQRGGEDVERSTTLASMTDPQTLEVRASVPIRYLPRIKTGQIADIRMSEMQFEGKVRKIVPAANPLSQTFEVRVDLPEGAPAYVAAGQLVSVTLPLTANAAMTVPRDSVVLREDGAFVMRINDDDKAERIAIEMSDASGERIAVRGDLAPGDRVAVRGAEALDDGQSVTVQAEAS